MYTRPTHYHSKLTIGREAELPLGRKKAFHLDNRFLMDGLAVFYPFRYL